MTTFYYAVGGGLGHVTRARRVLAALGLRGDAVIIASCSEAARTSGGIPVICVPAQLEGDRDAHRQWLDDILHVHRAERMIVDAFPAGIQGELIALRGIALDHVARLLRWDEYVRRFGHDMPRFETAYLVESIAPAHEAWIASHSERIATLDLGAIVAREAQTGSSVEAGPFWLIVHSGPASEVDELIAWTADLMALRGEETRVLVATTQNVRMPEGFERTDAYPVSKLFPAAARIVSAAGFNIMLETEPWRAKHEIMPLPRSFDDQFARAARRRAGVWTHFDRSTSSMPARSPLPAGEGGAKRG